MVGDVEGGYMSGLIAEANLHIFELGGRLEVPGERSAWDFVCECGRSDCHDVVTLSLAQYEALRREGGAVLAPGHVLPPAEKARREARESVEDAKALKAAARQQERRARRNLEEARGQTLRQIPRSGAD
jgi:hypothetical protein